MSLRCSRTTSSLRPRRHAVETAPEIADAVNDTLRESAWTEASQAQVEA